MHLTGEFEHWAAEWTGQIDGLFESCVATMPSPEECTNFGISNGAAFFALFLTEASRRLRDSTLSDKVEIYLERAVDLLNECTASGSLYSGLPGVAWSVHVASQSRAVSGASSLIAEANAAILASAEELQQDANLDVIDGVAGIIIYSLRCMSRQEQELLMRYIERWISVRFDDWLASENRLLPRSQGTNLGLAHGVPGLLSALAKANKRLGLNASLKKVVIRAIDNTWKFAVPEKAGGAYMPLFQDLVTQGRLAWCYGSLGVVFSYLEATSLDQKNASRANLLVSSCLNQYGQPNDLLKDASLCHGTSGAAFLFSRIARESYVDEDLRLKSAKIAKNAAEQTMQQAIRSGDHVTFPHSSEKRNSQPTSFLEGRYGVALALDALSRAELPAWSELLAV